jgi:hypothetical protein
MLNLFFFFNLFVASRRRRNYILDQTNVYASARKRKMRHFVSFRRICAVLQPEDEELKRREWKRTFEDGELMLFVSSRCFVHSILSSSSFHLSDVIEL